MLVVRIQESCRGIMVAGAQESLQMKWLRFELNRNEPRGFMYSWKDGMMKF